LLIAFDRFKYHFGVYFARSNDTMYNIIKFKFLKNANDTVVTLQTTVENREEQVSFKFSLKCSQAL